MSNENTNNTTNNTNLPKKKHEQIIFRKLSKKFYNYKFVKRWSIISVFICIALVYICFLNGSSVNDKTDMYNRANSYISSVAKPASVKSFADNEGEFNYDFTAEPVSSSDYTPEEDMDSQLSSVLGKKHSEYIDSANANVFAVRSACVAFDGFNKLTEPACIYNYSGEIRIKGVKIKRLDTSYEDIYCVFYNPEKDTYTFNRAYVDSNYEYSDSNRYNITFRVKTSHPFCVIKCSDDKTEKNYSLLTTIICNRLIKTPPKNLAFVSDNNYGKLVSFNGDNELNPTVDERFFKQFADVHDGGFKLETDSYKKKLEMAKEGNNLFYSGKTIKINPNVGTIAPVFRRDNLLVKTATKSIGYAHGGVHKSGFTPDKNGFAFTPYQLSSDTQLACFAMAEIASDYYNYRKLGNLEGADVPSALSDISLAGINNTNFTTLVEYKKNQQIRVINENVIKNVINAKAEYDAQNLHISTGTVTKTSGGLSQVIKQLDSGKTVVAYLTNGKKATAVVVYEIDKDAVNDNKYYLRVYDPNFPAGKITTVNKDGEEQAINTNMYIEVTIKPDVYYIDGERTVKYSMVYEYGNTLAYHWGNSGKRDGLVFYRGGEILFKMPTDPTKTDEISFIGN